MELVTEDMKAEMLRRMAALRRKYPDKHIALSWDFDSLMYRGHRRMVVKFIKEKNT